LQRAVEDIVTRPPRHVATDGGRSIED
jgi:hypothetical protein